MPRFPSITAKKSYKSTTADEDKLRLQLNIICEAKKLDAEVQNKHNTYINIVILSTCNNVMVI